MVWMREAQVLRRELGLQLLEITFLFSFTEARRTAEINRFIPIEQQEDLSPARTTSNTLHCMPSQSQHRIQNVDAHHSCATRNNRF